MLAAIIAIVAVVLDQVTKYFVMDAAQPIINMESPWKSDFIPHVISFDFESNTGAAFSSFDAPSQRWIFMTLSIISMAIIVYLLVKEYKRHRLMNIALAMILGGGIGNMIDRIRLEYVVDFLKFEFVRFAVFNVADCFVTVGAVLLGFYIIFIEPKITKRELAEKALREKAALAETELEGNASISENADITESISENISKSENIPQNTPDDTPKDEAENG